MRRHPPQAHIAVRALRARGIGVHMLTGDNERCARAVARELGIPPWCASPRLALAIEAGLETKIALVWHSCSRCLVLVSVNRQKKRSKSLYTCSSS